MTTTAATQTVDNTAALAYLADVQTSINARLEAMRSAITTDNTPSVNGMLEAMSGFVQDASMFEEQFFLIVDDGTLDFRSDDEAL